MLPELDTSTEPQPSKRGHRAWLIAERIARLSEPQPLTSEHVVRIGAQTLLVLIVVAWLVVMCCGGAAPPIGWTTTATVIRTKDGDTCRVRIVREFDVRLRSCWSPELREPGGPEARDHLKSLIDGKEVVVHIPGHIDLSKMTSLSRFVGDVYVGDVDVAEAQRKAGHATAEKPKEQK